MSSGRGTWQPLAVTGQLARAPDRVRASQDFFQCRFSQRVEAARGGARRAPLYAGYAAWLTRCCSHSIGWRVFGDFGKRPSLPDTGLETTEMQDVVRARALDTATLAYTEETSGPDAPTQTTDEESLQAILRGRGGYSMLSCGANNLAAFDPLRVALPSSVGGSPMLAALLPVDAAHFLR